VRGQINKWGLAQAIAKVYRGQRQGITRGLQFAGGRSFLHGCVQDYDWQSDKGYMRTLEFDF